MSPLNPNHPESPEEGENVYLTGAYDFAARTAGWTVIDPFWKQRGEIVAAVIGVAVGLAGAAYAWIGPPLPADFFGSPDPTLQAGAVLAVSVFVAVFFSTLMRLHAGNMVLLDTTATYNAESRRSLRRGQAVLKRLREQRVTRVRPDDRDDVDWAG